MSDLAMRAADAGLIPVYRDGAGRMQSAPEASIEAVLAALGHDNPAAALPDTLATATSRALQAGLPAEVPPGPWLLTLQTGDTLRGDGPLPPLAVGYHRLEQGGRLTHLLAHPARLPLTARAWGVTLPLFGLWDRAQTGMGNYPMLGDLAASLAPHGAAFIGINPVHAGFPLDAANFSPYAPSHRRRLNILHAATGAPLPDTGPLIDHAATVPALLAALRATYQDWPGDPAFDSWQAAQGAALADFATHQALSEVHGPYWNRWPLPLQNPDSDAVRSFARTHGNALRFHAWAQWQAERQLADAQAQAIAAGMGLGLYLDLAVGTHPFGAETWGEQALFARGISLGAPADLLGPSGQRWGLAPMRPDVLHATGFQALRETLAAQLRHAGMLRIDHILGFERSFWLPDGLPGLYVRMPRAEMLAVTLIEASRARGGAGAVIVGEDLGTIPEGLRAGLADSGILGCRLAVFERDWDGDRAFLPPQAYDTPALASWGSHDTPTWAGWRAGRDLDWRDAMGELPDAGTAHDTRRAEVVGFDAIAGPTLDDLHRHLAATPCVLVALQVEDLAGAVEQCNLPGTIHQHPNWRRRLPMPAPALGSSPELARAAEIMAAAGRNPTR